MEANPVAETYTLNIPKTMDIIQYNNIIVKNLMELCVLGEEKSYKIDCHICPSVCWRRPHVSPR
jgi:hypothetical protein